MSADKRQLAVKALLLLTLCAVPVHSFATDGKGPKIGEDPPRLHDIKILQGSFAGEVSWNKLKGKVVVLEFWGTGCAPCIKAIPHLNALAEGFINRPVVFLSLSGENEGVIREFLKKTRMKTWVGLDDYDLMKEAFNITGIPTAFVIDAQGKIAAITHPASLESRHLEEILAGKKCSLPEPKEDEYAARPEVEAVEKPALFEISIRERKVRKNFSGACCMWEHDKDFCRFKGELATIESSLHAVFGKTPTRVILKSALPDEKYYDFHLKAPTGKSLELQDQFIAALRVTFGLEVKRIVRQTDSYILTQINKDVPGLRKVNEGGGGGDEEGGFSSTGTDLDGVAESLEGALGKPVINETKLTGDYAVKMKWEMSKAEKLRSRTDRKVWKAIDANPGGDWISSLPKEMREGKALEDLLLLKAELAKPETEQFRPDPRAVIAAAHTRLGLELTPVRRPVELLVVTKIAQESH